MNPYATLSNKELLSIVVMERKDESIAQTLLAEFDSVPRIINSEREELLRIKGIGVKRANQLQGVFELARRLYSVDPSEMPHISSPKDAAKIAIPDLRYEMKEHFKIMILDTKNHVLSYETISIGSLNASIVHPREVFKIAIQKSGNALVLIHNHPSGDPSPSPEDISITKRLQEAGEIIGIKVLDHVIIGGNKHFSLKEQGLM